ncbi:MAG: DUF2125 domain-containing protein, partial [Alphaproteobacteria bacterium]|nr:DUF2125 domain-containing protein [Alphaproteobacteria bacterium]
MNKFMWLGAAVLGFVAVWTGGWYFLAGQVRGEIERASGSDEVQLNCAGLAIDGYPFRFDVTCTGAVIVSGDISVTSPQIKATALVYRPTHILAFVDAPISVSDAFSGSREQFTFSSLQLSARFSGLLPDELAIARISMVASTLEWRKPLFGDRLEGRLDELEVHLVALEDNSERGLAAFVQASGVKAEPDLFENGKIDIRLELA